MFRLGRPKQPGGDAEAAPFCSFCNKGQADVRKLIAGPTVMICDDCVSVCVDIIVEDARASEADGDRDASRELHARLQAHRLVAEGTTVSLPDELVPLWHVRCALCGQVVPTDEAVSIEGRGVLCDNCLAAAQAIAAQTGSG